ncbi:MAG TPA: hypothetical protein VFR00_01745 [Hyphomicrobiaceae bacterium]|jgi:hypothetical protein|nr:hypothetical protein [Hyphomicrobiaceae bacterium]
MAKRDAEKELLAGPHNGPESAPRVPGRRRSGYQRQSVGEAIAKSFIRSVASSLGRILARAITGRMR